MKKIISYVCAVYSLLIPLVGLNALSEHIQPIKEGNCPVVRYRLVDLGSAGLERERMTKLELVFSLAPSINNLGQLVYNTSQGAFVRDPAFGEYILKVNGVQIYAHSLNNKGEMLVSLNRADKQTEWMLWPRRSPFGLGWDEGDLNIRKRHIANLENPDEPLFMCALNDDTEVSGYRQHSETLIPLTWTPECGLNPMGSQWGYHILGFTRGLNNRGTIVGYYQQPNDSPPFVWNPCRGLQVLRNYRNLVQCQGWIELADIVLTQNDIVYGTYVVKHISKLKGNTEDLGKYFVYRWDPCRDEFLVLDIRNFRIAAVNRANTLVGTFNGEAAMRRQGDEPLELRKLVPDEMDGWQLLEATAINDRDQIVGYGLKSGVIHNFLIEPIP